MNPPIELELRHVCHECGRGRSVSYTRKSWRGPCCICRRPIFCDRILSGNEPQEDHDWSEFDSELSYWKHRCRIFEVLNRAADADLVEMKGRVARLEERLLLSDYHKEGKGVF